MYSAGRARHRITFQVRTLARNVLGEQTDSWSDFATVNAVITQQKGDEVWAGGGKQFVNSTPTQFEIRYRTDITTEMRIVWRSRVFRIESKRDPGEKRDQLTINGTEIEGAIA